MAYNDNNSGNGNNDGGTYGDPGGSNLSFSYSDSPFQFTDPIRYFKSNDPYYWEVDNIPLKQLQENCLWLRDQIGSGGQGGVGGTISRSNFDELRPFVSNISQRKVFVTPGNFIGRVNDAKSLGQAITSRPQFAGPKFTDVPDPTLQDTRLPPNYIFTLPDAILHKLVGNATNYPGRVGMNGLTDFAQHYNSYLDIVGPSLRYSKGTLFDQSPHDEQDDVTDVPTLKTALWKHSSTADSNIIDLQSLSTEFTRRWGGVARTAVVNVPETLSIDIPPFRADDYMVNDSTKTPSMRIDLVFLYTTPVDQKKTTIVKGGSVMEVTSPSLGLIKGAGLVLKPKGPNSDSLDIAGDSDNIANVATTATSEDYFIAEAQPIESGGIDVAKSIISPLGDQYDSSHDPFPTQIGGGPLGVFPAPDDLMNLAPLLAEQLENDDYALVGQSILPICYVISRGEDADGPLTSNNERDDIIDIRPFFRTAELAYNERAGIAAANPPLSFANQAVGARQLQEHIRNLKNTIDDYYASDFSTALSDIQQLFNIIPKEQPVAYGKVRSGGYPNQETWTVATGFYPMTHKNVEVLKQEGTSPIQATNDSNTFTLGPGKYEISLDMFIKYRHDVGNNEGPPGIEDNFIDWLKGQLVVTDDSDGSPTVKLYLDFDSASDEDENTAPGSAWDLKQGATIPYEIGGTAIGVPYVSMEQYNCNLTVRGLLTVTSEANYRIALNFPAEGGPGNNLGTTEVDLGSPSAITGWAWGNYKIERLCNSNGDSGLGA